MSLIDKMAISLLITSWLKLNLEGGALKSLLLTIKNFEEQGNLTAEASLSGADDFDFETLFIIFRKKIINKN